MSKSDPNSAIFMEDSEAEVKTKIKKAFCPPKQVRTDGGAEHGAGCRKAHNKCSLQPSFVPTEFLGGGQSVPGLCQGHRAALV